MEMEMEMEMEMGMAIAMETTPAEESKVPIGALGVGFDVNDTRSPSAPPSPPTKRRKLKRSRSQPIPTDAELVEHGEKKEEGVSDVDVDVDVGNNEEILLSSVCVDSQIGKRITKSRVSRIGRKTGRKENSDSLVADAHRSRGSGGLGHTDPDAKATFPKPENEELAEEHKEMNSTQPPRLRTASHRSVLSHIIISTAKDPVGELKNQAPASKITNYVGIATPSPSPVVGSLGGGKDKECTLRGAEVAEVESLEEMDVDGDADRGDEEVDGDALGLEGEGNESGDGFKLLLPTPPPPPAPKTPNKGRAGTIITEPTNEPLLASPSGSRNPPSRWALSKSTTSTTSTNSQSQSFMIIHPPPPRSFNRSSYTFFPPSPSSSTSPSTSPPSSSFPSPSSPSPSSSSSSPSPEQDPTDLVHPPSPLPAPPRSPSPTTLYESFVSNPLAPLTPHAPKTPVAAKTPSLVSVDRKSRSLKLRDNWRWERFREDVAWDWARDDKEGDDEGGKGGGVGSAGDGSPLVNRARSGGKGGRGGEASGTSGERGQGKGKGKEKGRPGARVPVAGLFRAEGGESGAPIQPPAQTQTQTQTQPPAPQTVQQRKK